MHYILSASFRDASALPSRTLGKQTLPMATQGLRPLVAWLTGVKLEHLRPKCTTCSPGLPRNMAAIANLGLGFLRSILSGPPGAVRLVGSEN